MDAAAPQILVSLEASAFAQAIRQSVWIYPATNVGHVVAVVAFAAAVAVMDFALLGLIGGERALDLARRARPVVIALFGFVAVTGALLFIAEASHVALNRVFQVKLAFVLLALINALLLGRLALAVGDEDAEAGAGTTARLAAGLSLGLWLTVVALGRSIAYF